MTSFPRCRVRSWVTFLLAASLVALLVSGGPAAAQVTSPAHQTGIELTVSTQRTLRQIGESTIQWHRAFLQEDRDLAAKELERLQGLLAELGMKTLPDQSLAALVRAEEVAEVGDFDRAAWALEAAEQLDPGRPETSFANARVHRLAGSYLKMLVETVRGYSRLFRFEPTRSLWLNNLVLWGLMTLMTTAVLYLLVCIASRGFAVSLDLVELLARIMPKGLALVFTLVLLVGPLALPFGLLWFLVLWSVLLWGYGSGQERVVLVLIWLLAGAVPILLEVQLDRVSVSSSAALQAANSVEEGRLYGRLLTDFGVLRAILPKSGAVKHLEADFHARIGQWDLARSYYAELLETEQQNSDALNNLGVYFFLHGDIGGAIQSFSRATVADMNNPAAFYNLSQAFSASYHYKDAREALQEAQRLDPVTISRWLAENDDAQVRPVEGSLKRIPEIQAQLGEALRQQREAEIVSARLRLLRRGFSLLIGCGIALIAAALHLARRGFGYSQPDSNTVGLRGDLELLVQVVVPGLRSIRHGRGFAAYLALVPLVGLLLVPFSWHWGYRLPWGFDPGTLLPWFLTTLGLVSLLLIRLLVLRASEA